MRISVATEIKTSLFIASLLIASCQTPEQQGVEQESFSIVGIDSTGCEVLIEADTLAKWENWAMRSTYGLWIGQPEHSIRPTLLRVLGGEEEVSPPFFKASFLAVNGNRIYVSDAATQQLVALSDTGTVIWKFGGPGEGPGEFGMIGSLDARDSLIAVCDYMNGRVTFVSHSGDYLGDESIQYPTDVILLSDTSAVVMSAIEPGGSVHLLSTDHGLERAFGSFEWGAEIPPRGERLFAIGSPDGTEIAVLDGRVQAVFLCDLDGTSQVDFAREYPAEIPGAINRDLEYGQTVTILPNLYWKPFIGPEGMLNIRLTGISADGGVTDDYHSLSPVSIVDRYDWQGNYLDSYALPVFYATTIDYSPECGLVVLQPGTGSILLFDI